MRDLDQARDIHGIGVDPWTFNVGEKHFGCPGHAKARMDALLAVVEKRQLLALDFLYAVHDGGCWRRGHDRRRCGRRRYRSRERHVLESVGRALHQIGEQP